MIFNFKCIIMYLVNKVDFNTNGGSSIDSVDVPYSLTLEEPTIPTKEGYIFNGWYEDEDKTVAFDFNKEITEDITLYAKWTKEYKFIKGDNQELTIDNISEYTFTIDGD